MYPSLSVSQKCTSEPQTPHARGRISTSRGPNFGSGNVSTETCGRRHTLLPVTALRVVRSNSVSVYPGRGSHSAVNTSPFISERTSANLPGFRALTGFHYGYQSSWSAQKQLRLLGL